MIQSAIRSNTSVESGESEINTNVPSAFLLRERDPRSCSALTFEYIDANALWQSAGQAKTREEFFLGCTIGTDVRAPARPGEKLKSLQRRTLSEKNQSFTINDLGEDRSGKTSTITEDRGWKILSDSPDNGQLIDEARSLLLEALSNQGINEVDSSYLQCNVNKYRSNDEMSLHRDDRDDKSSTFYPAAVTCLLFADSMTVDDQANACFDLYESPSGSLLSLRCKNYKTPAKYQAACKSHLVASESRSETLVCVAGASYTNGCMLPELVGEPAPKILMTLRRFLLKESASISGWSSQRHGHCFKAKVLQIAQHPY